MNKIVYFFVLALLAQSSVWAVDSYRVKPICDSKFQEMAATLRFGTYQEKIDAIGYFEQTKSASAVQPLARALAGYTLKQDDLPTRSLENYTKKHDELKPMSTTEQEDVIGLDYVAIPSIDDKPEIKLFAARVLGKLGHAEAIKPLVDEYKKREKEIKETDKSLLADNVSNPMQTVVDLPLVMAVGEMLKALGELPYSKDSADTLKEALNHKNYYIRASAADGLRRLGMVREIPAIESALEKEQNELTKAYMLSAIIGISQHENKHVVTLAQLLHSDNPAVQIRAAQGLAYAKIRTSETALRQQLEIEDNAVVRRELQESIKEVTSFDYPAYTQGQFINK